MPTSQGRTQGLNDAMKLLVRTLQGCSESQATMISLLSINDEPIL